MAHQDLGFVVEIGLYRVGEFGMDNSLFDLFVVDFKLFVENLRKPVALRAALAEHIRLARGNAYFNSTYTRAVLPPVVLLFHQKEKLVEPV